MLYLFYCITTPREVLYSKYIKGIRYTHHTTPKGYVLRKNYPHKASTRPHLSGLFFISPFFPLFLHLAGRRKKKEPKTGFSHLKNTVRNQFLKPSNVETPFFELVCGEIEKVKLIVQTPLGRRALIRCGVSKK